MADKNDKPAAQKTPEEMVMAKRVTMLTTAAVYTTKDGARKHAQAGADISDMCDEDLAGFKKLGGVITTKLVEVPG